MFSDSSEIEYIDYNNMNIFKEDISYEQDISYQQDQYIFKSEFEFEPIPLLFESEFQSESTSVSFLFEEQQQELEQQQEQQQELEQEQESTESSPIVLIKQLHMKYNNMKLKSVKHYKRGKLHYLTAEETIMRRREFNRLYAANSRFRKQQLKEQIKTE